MAQNITDLSKIKKLILEMEPTDYDLIRGLESWLKKDNVYWRALLAGSKILHLYSKFVQEQIIGIKNDYEYYYRLARAKEEINIPDIFFSDEIPDETKKKWIIIFTPVLKALGSFWREEKDPAEITMKEQKFMDEFIKCKDPFKLYKSYYKNPPRDEIIDNKNDTQSQKYKELLNQLKSGIFYIFANYPRFKKRSMGPKTNMEQNKITAEIVQTKNQTDPSKFDSFILLRGDIYPERTRLIPITVEEFKAIYIMIFEMIKESIREEEDNNK